MKRTTAIATVLAIVLCLFSPQPAHAHQPYFEEGDLTVDAPMRLQDPAISKAIYATLDTDADVDYFVFSGQAGQSILLGMSIPVIEGQTLFAPTIALFGAELPVTALPAHLVVPPGVGSVVIRDAGGEVPISFEPFSRTRYFRRHREHVTLPADGEYTVAVWHERGQVGRYAFIIGDREVRGGDPAFATKIRDYWTPVQVQVTPTPSPTVIPTVTPTVVPTRVPTIIPPPTTTLPPKSTSFSPSNEYSCGSSSYAE